MSAPPAGPADPRIGSQVGNFRLVRLLGEGGMGRVYLAEQPRIGKRVAVKLLRPELARDRGALARFFREAQLVNQINHPHIIDVIDLGDCPSLPGEDDGAAGGTVPYLVMELLEGESLAARLAAGPLDEAEARRIASQIAVTLEAVHARGITHRDLKPDNTFLVRRAEEAESVKLLDFGIAKLGEAEARTSHRLTRTGAIMGTPLYMAPEQLRAHEVGPPADVYALGCMLFELVTGRPPFQLTQDGSLASLMAAHLLEPPPRLTALCPGVTPAYEALALSCLSKEPAERPSAAAVAASLRSSGPPPATARHTPAALPPPTERTSPGRSRRTLWRAAALAGTLVTAAVAVVATRAGRDAPTPDSVAAATPPPAPAAPPGAPPVLVAPLPSPLPVQLPPSWPVAQPVLALPPVQLGPGVTRWSRLGLTGAPGPIEGTLCPVSLTSEGGHSGLALRLTFPGQAAVAVTFSGAAFTLERGTLWCTGGLAAGGLTLLCQLRDQPQRVCGATYLKSL